MARDWAAFGMYRPRTARGADGWRQRARPLARWCAGIGEMVYSVNSVSRRGTRQQQAGTDSRATMNNNNDALAIILIIDSDSARAEQLKSMIEFLDAPSVRIAAADNWHSVAADATLSAIFIGNGLATDDAEQVASEVRQSYPSVPLVMVDADNG